ncbi:MAG: FMN-binding protein [Aeromicrobium sp.]|uniref:FMN-binding protein n=1 Tax=Aeromicrobium sp. TaxID=1871063 RepID=UPI0039E479F5
MNLKTVWTTAAAATALLTAACGGADADSSKDDDTTTESTSSSSSSAEGSYLAGDYSAEGSYMTPGGQQSVAVQLTLDADGVITDLTVTPHADGGESAQFQGKFVSGIADLVVGKSIDELNVDKVSGSSLTSGGFNAAIETIKGEAAA